MTNVKKIDLNSKNFIEEFTKELKNKFPQVFNEDKIDCEKLKLSLGELVDTGRERFGMNWPGKANAIWVAQEPSGATLKPDRKSSVDFDTTENLYLEGDNLEILKLLQRSYFNKIKMIYIDPPYNTGKEFIYPDKYTEGLETYLQYTGQIDAQGKKFTTNTETDGRFHTKWMNMMWPRLYLARNLLTDNGVIFISIDDHEVDNLRKICNEIFGEENYLSTISIITGAGQNGEGVKFQKNKEECMVYCKNESKFFPNKIDKAEESLRSLNDAPSSFITRPDMGYTIYYNPKTKDILPMKDYDKSKINLNIEEEVYKDNINLIKKGYLPIRPGFRNKLLHRWRWGYETFLERKNEIMIIEKEGEYNVYFKQSGYNPPKNIMNFGVGTSELKELFEGKIIFDFPKSTTMLKYLIQIGSNDGDIILDFFSGSATTAHAIIQLNNIYGGNRKFIMTQLPEIIEKESEAYKVGYKNIAEIGEERIRRAGKKIIEENKDKEGFDEDKFDKGFKVYRLDKSNFCAWDGKSTENLQQQLFAHVDHVGKDCKDEDILYELLLKSGYELTAKVEEVKINNKKIYSVAGGELIVCLEKGIDKNMMRAIAERKPNNVICLNSGFKTDADLTNASQILKTNEIEFRTV